MKVIWKYHLKEIKETFRVPAGAQVLSAQLQDGKLAVWMMVDSHVTALQEITFQLFMTGEEFDPAGLTYLDTYQVGWMVCHVFYSITWKE